MASMVQPIGHRLLTGASRPPHKADGRERVMFDDGDRAFGADAVLVEIQYPVIAVRLPDH
jgi:hypothetical protein